MKFSDIVSMCFHNLFRRKMRTVLTTIGVVIGSCSILIMVSLGVGLNESYEKEIKSWSDVNMIEVYPTGDAYASKDKNGDELKLNDDAVKFFSGLEHVVAVMPYMDDSTGSIAVTSGQYAYSGSIVGVDMSKMKEMGYEFVSGREITDNDRGICGYFGENAGYSFSRSDNENRVTFDEKGNMLPPAFNPETRPLSIGLRSGGFDGKEMMSGSGDIQPIKLENGQPGNEIKVLGMIKSDGKDWLTDNALFVDISTMRAIQAQHAAANGMAVPDFKYSRVKIKADSFENVPAITKKLEDVGFSSSSAQQMLDSAKKTGALIQLALGALGAISMAVAAIGITNTMIMSIYERTKEIGVMKVLGCEVKNIKTLFLLEAGGIGFMGGFVGLVISKTVSLIVNGVATLVMQSDTTMQISQIPIWLAVAGVCFSAGVGVLAGYMPAKRAVQISALSAIKTE